MKELPESVSAYKRTPEFTGDSVPPGLEKMHNTKAGVWARIEVLEGELLYRILTDPNEEVRLDESRPGIVEPEVPHQIEIVGPVRFFVEFHRA